jgi:putative transposase
LKGSPEIFNTDQGSRFTTEEYVKLLKKEQVRISMDGEGRAIDNVFIERFWRSYKYEYLYLNARWRPGTVPENGIVYAVL